MITSASRTGIVFAIVIAAMCTTRLASATSLRALTLDELVRASDVVVHARVASATERVRRVNGRLVPFASARFSVLETLRGARNAAVTVEASVGRGADGRDREIVGWPRFVAGEEVVLFLAARERALSPVGLGQGVFRVQRARGLAICHRALEDVEIIGDTAIPERVPLADLRAAVLALGNTP